jgi:hypothetical protein
MDLATLLRHEEMAEGRPETRQTKRQEQHPLNKRMELDVREWQVRAEKAEDERKDVEDNWQRCREVTHFTFPQLGLRGAAVSAGAPAPLTILNRGGERKGHDRADEKRCDVARISQWPPRQGPAEGHG